MNFFLDSGIFIGKCDHKDIHHRACKTFFEKYPYDTNNHYSTKRVKDELSWNKFKLIKSGKGYDTALRLIHQCIQRWLKERLVKLVEYENNPQFNALCEEIKKVTSYKDAPIVTNAIFWCCKCDSNDDPTLVSVDFYHIVQKADKIIKTANSKCARTIPLRIKAVWDI